MSCKLDNSLVDDLSLMTNVAIEMHSLLSLNCISLLMISIEGYLRTPVDGNNLSLLLSAKFCNLWSLHKSVDVQGYHTRLQ